MIDRAGEQEKLNINGTVIVQNGLNITQELDLGFYVGIYAGIQKRIPKYTEYFLSKYEVVPLPVRKLEEIG